MALFLEVPVPQIQAFLPFLGQRSRTSAVHHIAGRADVNSRLERRVLGQKKGKDQMDVTL